MKMTSLILTVAICSSILLASGFGQEPQPENPTDAMPPGEELVNDRPAFFANVEVDRPSGRYRGGDTLTVKFKVEKDGYAYLLYHQADKTIVMLFPNKAHPDNRVKAGEQISIPTSKDYRFRIAAPFGEEALQVIASAEPIEALANLDFSPGRTTPVSKEVIQDLAEQIEDNGDTLAEHRVRLFTSPGEALLPPPRKPKRVALCIGVGKIKNTGEVSPRFRNGATLMSQLLQKYGAVKPENLKLLVDENATRANFESALTKWMPSVTQPGDTIFIFFHGHGAPVRNFDGTEADGFDEYLTTYDVDNSTVASTHKTGVVDDTLARWLQELPGRQIVVIVDTCFGGGLVDGSQRDISRFGRDEIKRVSDITQLNSVVLTMGLSDEVTWSPGGEKGTSWFAFAMRLALESEEGKRKLQRPINIQTAFEYFSIFIKTIQRPNPKEPVASWHSQEPTLTHKALLDIPLFP